MKSVYFIGISFKTLQRNGDLEEEFLGHAFSTSVGAQNGVVVGF